MCGFSITFEKPKFNIEHRGINSTWIDFNGYIINFSSLPLSSLNSGYELPIINKDEMLLFNGEIFNFKDFNKNYKSDTHYLYDLFVNKKLTPEQIHKESLKWDGFFSLCIIKRNGNCYLFTDILGKKQLYYSKKGIASEVKPIINNKILYDISEKDFGKSITNFDSVFRALPGKLYKYEQINKTAYFIAYNKLNPCYNDNLYKLIENLVEERLNTKINGISILLSSGLDSNIILHHAAKFKDKINIELVTLDNEETPIVKEIANFYRLPLQIVKIPNNIDYEDIFYHYELNLDYGSLIPNYYLFKACKNKTILTGDGADEFFGGYSRALIKDTFNYDVFMELPYYHNIRIDRMSMKWTKEARNPLMSFKILQHILSIPQTQLKGKQLLKNIYHTLLPPVLKIDKKIPLRINNKQENIDIAKKQFKKTWEQILNNI